MIAAQITEKVGAIARVLLLQLRRNRTSAALIKAAHATALSVGRVLHRLWLEVTGFTFLAIAGMGVMTTVREYGKYHGGQVSGPGRLILTIAFTVSFAWFGVSSFWRVNKTVSKQRTLKSGRT